MAQESYPTAWASVDDEEPSIAGAFHESGVGVLSKLCTVVDSDPSEVCRMRPPSYVSARCLTWLQMHVEQTNGLPWRNHSIVDRS